MFFYLCIVLFSDFLQFNGNFVDAQNNSEYRDWTPLSAVLEKDESFKWSTFHQDLSYHSNEMTPCPILHKTE